MVAETSKWYTAAIQAQPMKVLVETRSSGQILRESFQVTPQVSGKTRTSTHPQPLHLLVAVGLMLGCSVGHHKDLLRKYLLLSGPLQFPAFCPVFPWDCPYVSSSKLQGSGWAPIWEVSFSHSPRCFAFWES